MSSATDIWKILLVPHLHQTLSHNLAARKKSRLVAYLIHMQAANRALDREVDGAVDTSDWLNLSSRLGTGEEFFGPSGGLANPNNGHWGSFGPPTGLSSPGFGFAMGASPGLSPLSPLGRFPAASQPKPPNWQPALNLACPTASPVQLLTVISQRGAQEKVYGNLTNKDARRYREQNHATLKPNSIQAHKSYSKIFIRYCILFGLASQGWDGSDITLQHCCEFWAHLVNDHKAAMDAGINGADDPTRKGKDAVYRNRILVRSIYLVHFCIILLSFFMPILLIVDLRVVQGYACCHASSLGYSASE